MELVFVDLRKFGVFDLSRVKVLGFGDYQYAGDEKEIAMDLAKRNLKKAMSEKALLIGTGDYVDTASPSTRKFWSSIQGNVYDSFRRMTDEGVARYVEEIGDVLEIARGRWIGLLRGHHTWRFKDNSSVESRLAKRLGCKLLGDLVQIRFYLTDAKGKKEVRVMAAHGKGSGMYVTSGVQFIQGRIAAYHNFHAFIMGHQTKNAIAPVPLLSYKHGKDESINRLLVSTGGYPRAYMPGRKGESGEPEGSYVEQGLMPPTSLGSSGAEFSLHRHEDGRAYVDVTGVIWV